MALERRDDDGLGGVGCVGVEPTVRQAAGPGVREQCSADVVGGLACEARRHARWLERLLVEQLSVEDLEQPTAEQEHLMAVFNAAVLLEELCERGPGSRGGDVGGGDPASPHGAAFPPGSAPWSPPPQVARRVSSSHVARVGESGRGVVVSETTVPVGDAAPTGTVARPQMGRALNSAGCTG